MIRLAYFLSAILVVFLCGCPPEPDKPNVLAVFVSPRQITDNEIGKTVSLRVVFSEAMLATPPTIVLSPLPICLKEQSSAWPTVNECEVIYLVEQKESKHSAVQVTVSNAFSVDGVVCTPRAFSNCFSVDVSGVVPPPPPPSDLAARVVSLVKQHVTGTTVKQEATALAANYRVIQARIEKANDPLAEDAIVSREVAVEEVKKLNLSTLGARQTAWRPFWDALAVELSAMQDAGKLQTVFELGKAFSQIAAGLEAVQ